MTERETARGGGRDRPRPGPIFSAPPLCEGAASEILLFAVDIINVHTQYLTIIHTAAAPTYAHARTHHTRHSRLTVSHHNSHKMKCIITQIARPNASSALSQTHMTRTCTQVQSRCSRSSLCPLCLTHTHTRQCAAATQDAQACGRGRAAGGVPYICHKSSRWRYAPCPPRPHQRESFFSVYHFCSPSSVTSPL